MKIKTEIWEKEKEYIIEKLMTIFWAISALLITNVISFYIINKQYIMGTLNLIILIFTTTIQISYNKRKKQ